MVIKGRCHCGNITFELCCSGEGNQISGRACACSFCRKHGGVWTSDPQGRLVVAAKFPDRVSRYTFGSGTAEFCFCASCGVVPLVTSRIQGRLYAVVSVNAFEGLDPARIQTVTGQFDNESLEQRLARRQRNWIGDVEWL